ncbi:hypothetical protein GYMLUDRAFT_63882 [Collybiopsis luxurians FD-317 M1]|uniref:Uncharacterized protein n=1 Tax=Collybiopsis luxurians FD-317 M1 TaxID=944289 RepID=A0A0D0CDT2_9AGAR|nr:hypothetical protein GYMLUDRAFT_63882 [Collybiopsis luxurians FD-317 M1]
MDHESFASSTMQPSVKRSLDEADEAMEEQMEDQMVQEKVQGRPLINSLWDKLEEQKWYCQDLKLQLDGWEHQFAIKVAEKEKSLDKAASKALKDLPFLSQINSELRETLALLKAEKADEVEKHRQSSAQAASEYSKLQAERDWYIRNYNKLRLQRNALCTEVQELSEQAPGGTTLCTLWKGKQMLESNLVSLEECYKEQQVQYETLQENSHADLFLLDTLKKDAVTLKMQYKDVLDTKNASETALRATIAGLENQKRQDSDSLQQLQMQLQDLRYKLQTFDQEEAQEQYRTNAVDTLLLETMKGDYTELKSELAKLKELEDEWSRLDCDRLAALVRNGKDFAQIQALKAEQEKLLAENQNLEMKLQKCLAEHGGKSSGEKLTAQVQGLEVKLKQSQEGEAQYWTNLAALQDQHSVDLFLLETLKKDSTKLKLEYEKIKELRTALNNLLASVRHDLETERKSQQQLSSKHQACLQELEDERSALHSERLATQSKYEALVNDHNNRQSVLRKVEEDFANEKAENDKLQKLLDTKKASETALMATIDSLEKQKKQDSDSLQCLQAELQDLQSKLQTFDQEKVQEQVEYNALQNRRHKDLTKLQDLEAENQKLLAEKKDLETKLQKHLTELGNKSSEEEWRNLEVKLKECQKGEAKYQTNFNALRKEHAVDLHLLEMLKKDSTELKLEHKDLKASKVALDILLANVKRNLTSERELQQSLESRVSKLAGQVSSEDIHSQYQDQIQDLEEKLHASSLETCQCQHQIPQLQAQLSREKEKSSDSELQVEVYHAENLELHGQIFDFELEKIDLETANRRI